MLCLCKQENICMSILLHISLRKNKPKTGVNSWYFSLFSLTFFIKKLIKRVIYYQTVPLGVCCENCMSGFSTFVFNLNKSGNILFR